LTVPAPVDLILTLQYSEIRYEYTDVGEEIHQRVMVVDMKKELE
jgi:hypothetical protein